MSTHDIYDDRTTARLLLLHAQQYLMANSESTLDEALRGTEFGVTPNGYDEARHCLKSALGAQGSLDAWDSDMATGYIERIETMIEATSISFKRTRGTLDILAREMGITP